MNKKLIIGVITLAIVGSSVVCMTACSKESNDTQSSVTSSRIEKDVSKDTSNGTSNDTSNVEKSFSKSGENTVDGDEPSSLISKSSEPIEHLIAVEASEKSSELSEKKISSEVRNSNFGKFMLNIGKRIASGAKLYVSRDINSIKLVTVDDSIVLIIKDTNDEITDYNVVKDGKSFVIDPKNKTYVISDDSSRAKDLVSMLNDELNSGLNYLKLDKVEDGYEYFSFDAEVSQGVNDILIVKATEDECTVYANTLDSAPYITFKLSKVSDNDKKLFDISGYNEIDAVSVN